jgi:uncharacterized protein (DUF1697 family)
VQNLQSLISFFGGSLLTKTIAFLRAINVGGRRVKMDVLRQIFEEMGFANVETYIASGNVIFDGDLVEQKALAQEIEAGLQEALGYRVDTFVRTVGEITAVSTYQPFPTSELEGSVLYIGFLAEQPSAENVQKLQEFASDIDSFHVHGSEVYWLCRKTISQSKFTGAKLEKALGMPTTMRNQNTINKLVKKCQ